MSCFVVVIAALSGCRDYATRSNDYAALRNVTGLLAAELQFYGKHHYYGSLRELGPSGDGLIPAHFESGVYAGFRYTVEAGERFFVIRAVPIRRGDTGGVSFYVDESGLIRWTSRSNGADANSPVADW
jgi:hypothetical protein